MYQLLLSSIDAGYFYASNEHGEQQRYELDTSLPRALTEDEQDKIYCILNDKASPRSQHHESKYSWLMKSETGGNIGADFKFQLICDCKYKFSYRNKEQCPKCRQDISKLKTPTYLSYVYYYDIAKRKTKGVVAKAIEEKQITAILTSFIKENFTISKDLHDWSIKYLKLLNDKEIADNQSIAKAQQSFNDQIAKKKKKIREMYQEGMITKEEFQEDITDLEEQEKAQPKRARDWFKECTDTLNLSLSLQKTIENGSPQDRKEALSKFCSNLTWNGQNLNIINKPVIDVYIKGLNRVKAKIPPFEPTKTIEKQGLNDDFEEQCSALREWWDDVRTYILKNMEKEEL